MSLNDSKIRNLKSLAIPTKLSGSHGLNLNAKPTGSDNAANLLMTI